MTIRQELAAVAGRIESFELLIADEKLRLGAAIAKNGERHAAARSAAELCVQKIDEHFADVERDLTEASRLRIEEWERMLGETPKPGAVPPFHLNADDAALPGDPAPRLGRAA